MQPIPKQIIKSHPEYASNLRPFTTLLVDGSSLLEVCWNACKLYNSKGENYGAVSQFMIQMKLMMRFYPFRYVYVFFDGAQSGQLRVNVNPEYKANRDKTFSMDDISDYMKSLNEKVQRTLDFFHEKNKNKPKRNETEKADYFRQLDIIIQMLDNLFVRVIECYQTEADDFIAYYVAHKKSNERIIICSNDRDLTQLISDDVAIYIQQLKKFISPKNHTKEMGFNYHNVMLKKILCGDVSDNIKGIKGLGEKTLFDNFPDIKNKSVELDEIISRASEINEERKRNKKKPLKWAENIVNKVTDGIQGDKIYEINKEIIDLKNPLMSDEAKELIEMFMYAPLDENGRNMENLYKIIIENDIADLKNEHTFGIFFTDFGNLIKVEKENHD